MNRPGFRNRKPGRFLRTEINSLPQTAQLPGHRGSCLADPRCAFPADTASESAAFARGAALVFCMDRDAAPCRRTEGSGAPATDLTHRKNTTQQARSSGSGPVCCDVCIPVGMGGDQPFTPPRATPRTMNLLSSR